MPCAAPLLVSGVVDAYPEIFGSTTAEDYFSDAFNHADILGKVRSRNYTTDELNAAIKRGVPRYALKEWLDKCK
jgi:hypothetical protein